MPKAVQCCSAVVKHLMLISMLQVLGCGIRRVLFKRADCIYDGIYRFHVERRDLTQAMFQFRDAYDDPYHHYKDKSFKDDVDTALRAAILPHLVQFKELHCKDSPILSTEAYRSNACILIEYVHLLWQPWAQIES